MKALAIYKSLRLHRKLAEKRNLNIEQNRTAKVIIWFAATFVLIYLIGFAIMFSLIANDSSTKTAVEMMCSFCPFILAIDFALRFAMQQTPSQLTKPYVLLPIPRYACVNSFIVSSLLTSGNLIWFAMLIPYSLMSVVFGYGIVTTLLFLLFFWLSILANSQWYAIVRTLINDTMLYWLLPAAFYALAFSPWYIGRDAGIVSLLETYAHIGTYIDSHSAIPIIAVLAVVAAMAAINQKVQYVHVMRELAHTEKTRHHKISKFSFLDKYGESGQYMKLEIKTILRNKNPRKSFISATCITVVLTLLISFTDIYDNKVMANFWCMYNFIIYGAIMLVRIMCYEGNYIDGLMVRKENILSMLHAKYKLYCAMILLPLVLMQPTVWAGKWSIWMLLSYALFSAGFSHFVIFQMAVYNKQTIPLNTKFISKNGMENNYFQLVTEMVVLIVPMSFVSLLQSALSDNVCYIVMSAIGLAFIATHPIWLRNIYNRLMRRRYVNMEAFRSTR